MHISTAQTLEIRLGCRELPDHPIVFIQVMSIAIYHDRLWIVLHEFHRFTDGTGFIGIIGIQPGIDLTAGM